MRGELLSQAKIIEKALKETVELQQKALLAHKSVKELQKKLMAEYKEVHAHNKKIIVITSPLTPSNLTPPSPSTKTTTNGM
jgi:hypothetical protein